MCSKYSKILTKKFLEKEYTVNRKSLRQISKENNIPLSSLRNYIVKYNISVRKNIGKSHPNYKDGRSLGKYYCIDCEAKGIKIEISWQTYHKGKERCKSCSQKERFKNFEYHPLYKHGRTLVKAYCIDCNKLLSKNAFYYGYKRCGKCNKKLYLSIPQNNPNWKGGRDNLGRYIKRLDNYKSWRTLVFTRDNYICKKCNKTNCYLEVHHVKPFTIILFEFLKVYSQFSPIEDKETLTRLAITYEPFWNISNGITLCKNCHNIERKETFNKIKNLNNYKFKREKIHQY